MRTHIKLCFVLCLFVLCNFVQAQENISLANSSLSPSPVATVENNGGACISFNAINVSLPGYDSAGTQILVELSKIAPKNGVNSISSSLEDDTKYEWEYDVDSNSFRGYQIDPIGFLYAETFTICCDVIENSSCDSIETVGFGAEAFIISGSDGNDSDNFVSSFTCTLESISSVDNSKALDPNLIVSPNPTSGRIYIDSTEDIETVQIYNFLGELVQVSDYATNGILLKDIPDGYYLCRVLSAKNDLIALKEIFVTN